MQTTTYLYSTSEYRHQLQNHNSYIPFKLKHLPPKTPSHLKVKQILPFRRFQSHLIPFLDLEEDQQLKIGEREVVEHEELGQRGACTETQFRGLGHLRQLECSQISIYQ